MAQPRVAIYLKVIAVIMLLSALSHLGSILGMRGTSWAAKPLHFRVGDIALLAVTLALAWGLWRTKPWAVVGWVAVVVLLQFIPFLLFTEYFATTARERMMLYGQLVTHAALLGVLWVLLRRRN
jgi:hypothetical protein